MNEIFRAASADVGIEALSALHAQWHEIAAGREDVQDSVRMLSIQA